jgi:methylated-DNA-[protein]-cysteine S-methyltransferase
MPGAAIGTIIREAYPPTVDEVRYEAPGFGVGSILLEDGLLLWHETPRPGGPPARPAGHELAGRFAAFFAGDAVEFGDVELDPDGYTGFGGELCAALRAIPRGEVVTYGELAALAGRPGAARAAGTFCAQNRFAVVVPCHRVVSAGGIGGYGSLGPEYKRRMLALEGVRL